MWIFADFGLLMPAAIPAEKVNPEYLGPNGDFDLQIRARAVSHLENFIRDYATPMGLAHSEIQKTPEMDYNCRVYMRQEDFAAAVAQMVLNIDYRKFKPTAEAKNEDGTLKFREGKEYHGVLNSIWGAVCRLGAPGGSWGPYSATNPNGYRPGARGYRAWGGTSGRTYRDTAWGRGYSDDVRGDDKEFDSYTVGDLIGDDMWLDDEYVPDSYDRKMNLLLMVEGLPSDQWDDWLSREEMAQVREEHEALMRSEKRLRKQARRSGRRWRKKARA